MDAQDSGRFALRLVGRLVLCAGLLGGLSACGSDQSAVGGGAIDTQAGGDAAVGDLTLADVPVADSSAQDLEGDSGISDGGVPDSGVPDSDSAAEPDDSAAACPADHCLITGECIANGAVDPNNACQHCQVVDSATAWSAFDAATCDDGKPCTLADHCDGGQCLGTAKECGDGNLCTDDSCDASGACVSLPAQATCEDGDVCTLGDFCKKGVCGGGLEKIVCSDDNPCTTNSCDPAKGCTYTANFANCDDGSACTTGDICKAAACLPGATTSCDDADLCTIDSCDPKKGCQHASIANLCTDTNPCTDEACDPKQGCVFPFNTIACDDLNACTALDTCSQGACLGAAVNPDDANLCTDDSCNPAIGPVHVANSVPCDDANACTLNDTCSGAACQPGSKPLLCDDKNVCTDDSCDPKKGCVFAANASPCDDGTACTQDDVCSVAVCKGAAVDCNDGNACTNDSCDAKSGCAHDLIVSNACRPLITVDFPPRAATVQQNTPTVTVTGKVKSGAGPITAFTLNGASVKVNADGTFSAPVQAQHGGNTLVFQAKDSFGSSKKRVQAFLFSGAFYKPDADKPGTGMVDPGLGFWLGQAVIDSGSHDLKKPHDIATIFEIVMKGMDLNALIPNPVYDSGGAKVSLSNLKYDPAQVSLKAQPGSLHLIATLPNVSADLAAGYKICLPFVGCNTLNVNGSMTMSSIVIASDMVLSVNPDHTLAVKLQNTTVALNGMKVAFSNPILNFLVAPLVNVLIPLFKTAIQNAFASQIGAALEPTISSALGALAIKTSFDVPKLDGSGGKVTVALFTDFAAVAIETAGAEFDLRARATAKKAIAYDNLGVPARQGCGAEAQKLWVLKKSPLELSVADDSFNELLYATWQGGLFEFPVPASLLGSVDLAGYGISDLKLKVSGMLAPTMADCNAKGELIAHVGDLRVDATLKLFGQQMDVIMYATFTAGVQVVAKDGKLGISLDKVQTAELQVDVQQDNLVSSENVLEKLVKDNLLTGLVGALGGNALGSFPIPAIDLSAAAKLPPGTAVLAINPTGVTRKAGNSVVGGTLQ